MKRKRQQPSQLKAYWRAVKRERAARNLTYKELLGAEEVYQVITKSINREKEQRAAAAKLGKTPKLDLRDKKCRTVLYEQMMRDAIKVREEKGEEYYDDLRFRIVLGKVKAKLKRKEKRTQGERHITRLRYLRNFLGLEITSSTMEWKEPSVAKLPKEVLLVKQEFIGDRELRGVFKVIKKYRVE